MDVRELVELMPFAGLLGIDVVSAAPEEVVATFDWDEARCTTAGVIHGGALMSVADTAGAACAFLNLPEGAGTTTVESSTRFFRAVRDGRVTATSRPLHAGRRFVVVQTELRTADGRLVAQTTQTQAVL